MTRFVLPLAILFFLPLAASAHAIGVDARIVEDKVRVEAYFDDDTPARDAKVEVLDGEKVVVAEGRTDEKGYWTFAKPKPGKLRTTSATYTHDIINTETGQNVGQFNRVHLEVELPAGLYEVKFGPASWKGIEVRSEETTTIEPGVLHIEVGDPGVFVNANVVDSETGDKHGTFDPVASTLTLLPGVYDLRFAKTEWRYVKVDGGKTTSLRAVAVILAEGLEWKQARVTTADGTEVAHFDAVTWKVALPPGDYVVEVDGNKIPFPATEGEVLEIKPQ